MYAALSKAGVPASFVRIEGAGHGFSGVDLTRANAEMVRWFEQHLRGTAKENLAAVRGSHGQAFENRRW